MIRAHNPDRKEQQMSESMLERVARLVAIQVAQHCGKDGLTSTSFSNAAWTDYRDDARAILSALRDPTDAELGRAIQVRDQSSWHAHRSFWNAVIEAALAEPVRGHRPVDSQGPAASIDGHIGRAKPSSAPEADD